MNITALVINVLLVFYLLVVGLNSEGWPEFLNAGEYNTCNTEVKIQNKDSAKDEELMSKVMDLPEVKRANVFIDSISNHKHGISIMIISRPDKTQDYYDVLLGYNNDFRFETYFNFYVYTPKLDIKYYNVIGDTIISLDEWRNKRAKGIVAPLF
jgi:hypothetical protein